MVILVDGKTLVSTDVDKSLFFSSTETKEYGEINN
jgi:hypothetical protein